MVPLTFENAFGPGAAPYPSPSPAYEPYDTQPAYVVHPPPQSQNRRGQHFPRHNMAYWHHARQAYLVGERFQHGSLTQPAVSTNRETVQRSWPAECAEITDEGGHQHNVYFPPLQESVERPSVPQAIDLPQWPSGSNIRQETAYCHQARQTHLVGEQFQHGNISQSAVFAHNATVQPSWPTECAEIPDEGKYQQNVYFPPLQESVERPGVPQAIDLAQRPSDNNTQGMVFQPSAQMMHIPHQMGGGAAHVVDGVQSQASGSYPNYHRNNQDHDIDNTCINMYEPPAMTAAQEQSDISSRRKPHPTPHGTVPQAPAPSRTRTRRHTSAAPTEHRATLNTFMLSKAGKCGTKTKDQRLVTRHWFTCHVMDELKKIENKELDMARATIITTEARRLVAKEYSAYVRDDSLVRHMIRCGKARNKKRADDPQISVSALRWTRRNMRLFQYDKEVFTEEYEAAVWMVHNAC
ncbi:hypothetical protein JB92DRAFT_3102922 [Gautieria morchelliformis]|nr:hypothetical protein JB92DRAFT_3102922 [Gautieria morchelliformis]